MNDRADPCEDFAAYACGKFYNEATLRNNRPIENVKEQMLRVRWKTLIDIMAEEVRDSDSSPTKKFKNHYQSCRDAGSIMRNGVSDFRSSDQALAWPTLADRVWVEDGQFDLAALLDLYHQVGLELLFSIEVKKSRDNSSRNAIYLSEGPGRSLIKSPITPFNYSVNGSLHTLEVSEIFSEIAAELGADKHVAARDISDVKLLLRDIELISTAHRERTLRRMTLEKLGSDYAYLNLPRMIRSLFATANITLPDDQEVFLHVGPDYLNNMTALLMQKDPRVIRNMFGFFFAYWTTNRMTPRLNIMQDRFEKLLPHGKRGLHGSSPEKCAREVDKWLPVALAEEYGRRMFSDEDKQQVTGIFQDTLATFREGVKSSKYLGDVTKRVYGTLLDSINAAIGYADKEYFTSLLDWKDRILSITPDHWMRNVIALRKAEKVEELLTLRQPVDTPRRHLPTDIKANYRHAGNDIVLTTGYLQPPRYSRNYSRAYNFGSVGSKIGRLIIRALLVVGRPIRDRNEFQWWKDNQSAAAYSEQMLCLYEQFAGFVHPVLHQPVDAAKTFVRNLFDKYGANNSYRAYHRRPAGQIPVRDLNLTEDQVFFLSYAQSFCSVETQRRMEWVMTSEYAPKKFRIIGPLQNMREFAEAFSCPVASSMNPKRKCTYT